MEKKVIIIAGPTAVGKTSVAIEVARHYQTEIISADSRQCFHELNIGVARPFPEELNCVPHHFIASHSIHDHISAADYEKYALAKVSKIFENKNIAVVAGGTGLYLKALMLGLDNIPPVDITVREQIIKQYEADGIEWLTNEINIHDPLFASSGEMQNPQRMIRALEVFRATGQSIISYHQKKIIHRPFGIIVVLLDLPRNELYARINKRVDQMIDAGLIKEVEALYPYRHLNALHTVGYTELFDFIEGESSLETSVEKIKQHTRQYAKRQNTWFKHQLDGTYFRPEDVSSVIQYLDEKILD